MDNMQNTNNSNQLVMDNTGSYSPFSTVLGNVSIQSIQPQTFGAVVPSFGQIGYISVEQVAAALAMSAPQQSSIALNSTQNRSTVIQGTTSYQDQNGNVSMVMGYSASGIFK